MYFDKYKTKHYKGFFLLKNIKDSVKEFVENYDFIIIFVPNGSYNNIGHFISMMIYENKIIIFSSFGEMPNKELLDFCYEIDNKLDNRFFSSIIITNKTLLQNKKSFLCGFFCIYICENVINLGYKYYDVILKNFYKNDLEYNHRILYEYFRDK